MQIWTILRMLYNRNHRAELHKADFTVQNIKAKEIISTISVQSKAGFCIEFQGTKVEDNFEFLKSTFPGDLG